LSTLVKFRKVAYGNAGNNATLYETEVHNSYEVVPEYPSLALLFLPIVTTLLATIARKRKCACNITQPP
jgi:hypothetical protein